MQINFIENKDTFKEYIVISKRRMLPFLAKSENKNFEEVDCVKLIEMLEHFLAFSGFTQIIALKVTANIAL